MCTSSMNYKKVNLAWKPSKPEMVKPRLTGDRPRRLVCDKTIKK